MTDVSEFLSCDWGTTSFRLRLVDTNNFRIIAEEKSTQGSSNTFEEWKKTGRPESERFDFYLSVIRENLNKLESSQSKKTDNLPLLISGMATSSIGMFDLPYKNFPFTIDGADLVTKTIASTDDFKHETILISGVRTDNDVMRGEEVQLVGCDLGITEDEQMFIHPGTHSKHVVIKNGKALALKTYMTGELFSLLSSHSILTSSLEKGSDIKAGNNKNYFEQGVRQGISGNVLHEMFSIRINDLFNRSTKQENAYYLSGLLIGTELKDFAKDFSGLLTLAGEPVLVSSYETALNILGISKKVSAVQIKNADEVTLKGQFKVFAAMHQPH